MRLIGPFRSIALDHSPRLLEESYRLRYQVYCLERRFLDFEGYPDGRELDEFDRDSIHVGVMDAAGILAATARIVKPTSAGWPLLRHCALSAHQATLGAAGNLVVELSRVCISRRHSRRRHDVFYDGPDLVGSDPPPPMHDRRDNRDDLFTSLVKAMYQATKRIGATHWLIAVENSLRRRIARYGLPFQAAGPEVDYWGLVAPHIMSVAELDQVILGRHFVLLDEFLEGLEPGLWPSLDGHDTAPRHVVT